MSTLAVYDIEGGKQGQVEIADDLLVLDKGECAVHQAVVAHQAANRAGTASTLRKGEVAGSNKKPWRQKGTGMARAGYRQSPVWRGGGVAFGPHPRSYAKKMPKKMRRLAFRRALSERIKEGSIKLLDNLTLSEPKTKAVASVLKALGVEGSVLLVLEKADQKVTLSCRNMSGVEMVTAQDANTYQILKYSVLVASRGAMEQLKSRLLDDKAAK